MKKALKIIGITILVCTMLFTFFIVNNVGFAGTTTSNVSKIYSFGDNYSDSGNSYTISSKLVDNSVPDSYLLPAEPTQNLYWQGRWTNGPTAVEVLSQNLNVDLKNYSVGGATSGYENYHSWLVDDKYKTGLLGQVKKFETELKGNSANPEALYFIFASSNDYFYTFDNEDSVSTEELSTNTVKNITTAITKLQKLGAKKFMVVNSPELSKIPWEFITSRFDSSKDFSNAVNEKLPVELDKLTDSMTSILQYDYTKIEGKIFKDPSSYGISEIIRPYQRTYPDTVKGTGNVDTYYYYDEWNPTKAVHGIVGDDMADKVMGTYPK
jgi:phospholipase/lecithinase/hemolysin